MLGTIARGGPACCSNVAARSAFGPVARGCSSSFHLLWHPRVLAVDLTGPAWVARCASGPAGTSTTGAKVIQYNVRPITKDDVDFAFARSGGAGGQNVNKVNTKVDMRWELDKAGWVPEEVKEAIRRMEKNKFTKDGFLVVSSTRHRTQAQNLEDALQKLQDMIERAVEAVTPKEVDPATIKRIQANIKAGNERRLDGKKKDAHKKTERRRRDWD